MVEINWLEEVEKRKDALLEDLFRQLKIASVRDDEAATEEAPVGPGPKAALEDFMKMAEEDGFKTEQFGPWAGHVEAGEGEELLGILGHVDVVPVGTGWDTDPFEPVIKDGRIYARGSSDDKGPTVAAYFALKLLRDLGLELNQRVRIIVGTDEESGWQCMDHYFKEAEMPDYGFSPDANFPIINGEKGNVSAQFKNVEGDEVEADNQLVSFKAGLRANMVPQDVEAVVKAKDAVAIEEAFKAYIDETKDIQGEVERDGDTLTFKVVGKAAHGSTPEKGINAATYLAAFLKDYSFNREGANNFIQALGNLFHQDPTGKKLGVAIEDDVMGALSMNIGIANYTPEEGGFIDANFRYPKGIDAATLENKSAEATEGYKFEVSMGDDTVPHYVPGDDPLVETLLQVYEDQTGNEGFEKVIGGGTYARLMPRGVAYGALFPDSIDVMHQANEFLAVDDLLRATAIYADAIYRLTR